MIYQWDLNREPAGEPREAYWKTLAAETSTERPRDDDFAEQLFERVTSQVSRIDDLIREHASNWRLERMAAVDRNILRMAVSELLDETEAPAVIINEAMEVGRRFSDRRVRTLPERRPGRDSQTSRGRGRRDYVASARRNGVSRAEPVACAEAEEPQPERGTRCTGVPDGRGPDKSGTALPPYVGADADAARPEARATSERPASRARTSRLRLCPAL